MSLNVCRLEDGSAFGIWNGSSDRDSPWDRMSVMLNSILGNSFWELVRGGSNSSLLGSGNVGVTVLVMSRLLCGVGVLAATMLVHGTGLFVAFWGYQYSGVVRKCAKFVLVPCSVGVFGC